MCLIAASCKQQTQQQTQSNQVATQPTATPVPSPTPPPTMLKTPGGIEITDIQWGAGATPPPGATVQFRYQVLDPTGAVLDSTDGLPQPVEVRWDDPGAGTFGAWKEVLGQLPAGSKAKARIPADIAFGQRGYREVIAPNTDLTLVWEVVAIVAPETATPTRP